MTLVILGIAAAFIYVFCLDPAIRRLEKARLEPDTTCDNDVGRRCCELWPDHRASWCEGCCALIAPPSPEAGEE